MTKVPIRSLRKLPRVPAIYFVYDGTTCLYVGQAINLRKRWAGHHRKKQIQDKHPDAHIEWIEAREVQLELLEKKYISELDPILNGRQIIQERPPNKETTVLLDILGKLGTPEGTQAFEDFFFSIKDKPDVI